MRKARKKDITQNVLDYNNRDKYLFTIILDHERKDGKHESERTYYRYFREEKIGFKWKPLKNPPTIYPPQGYYKYNECSIRYIPLVRVVILVINKLVNLHCRIKYGKMKTKLKL